MNKIKKAANLSIPKFIITNIITTKWSLVGVFGLFFILSGFFLLRYNHFATISPILSIISGFIFLFISSYFISKNLFYSLWKKNFEAFYSKANFDNFTQKKSLLSKGPKIVTIGGGTGLSTMLRGLKEYTSNITAVVTVADDGGGSGVLRNDLGMLPPGDIRNCILALADTEPIMEKLLQYRFEDGMLKGQSFGNLFLAAMDGISSSFEEAVRRMSDVLAVTGRVLPVTLENIKLCATLEDGFEICGESNIGSHNNYHKGRIEKVYLEPVEVEPFGEAIEAILAADLVIFGPGSLYTSIIPNLLVKGISEAIKNSQATKVYVCNVMTQPGETDHYTVADHIIAIEDHSYQGILDYCIANSADIPLELEKKYMEDGAEIVKLDVKELSDMGINVIEKDFVCINNNYIRHDTKRLAQSIIDIVCKN